MVNRHSHIALCYGYTFIIRNHRIDSTSQVQAYYHYQDSDYAGSATPGRTSISGYCFFVFCNLVTWKSKLQPLTAGPTHEAELISMSFAADEAV